MDFTIELRDVRLALDRMLHRDLRGIFDARDSSSAIDWNAKGIVIDLSQVFNNPQVLRLLDGGGHQLADQPLRLSPTR